MATCEPNATGQVCLPQSNWKNCRPWELTEQTKTNCYADGILQESLQIAGANINVHKLLGIHEQTKLLDLTGTGTPISGGDLPPYSAAFAFSTHKNEWRSRQSGNAVITSSYIGYDFGVVKLPNGRARYGIPANVRQHITTIKIKQSSDPQYRVTKARVERSDNGTEWYGVAIINLPDDDKLNTINFKQSVPNRYWRLRPLTFGGAMCSGWGIQALELHDYAVTQQNNIQDKILLENHDRDYATEPIQLKGYYDLVTANLELTKLGMDLPSLTYTIKINFNACISAIGRPLVIGDIVELPSETQYTPALVPVKRYLEVTDVGWDTQSYTPGWVPTMLSITASPVHAAQETRDIFGGLDATLDSSGLFNGNDGNSTMFQDYSTIDQTIRAEANTAVPERGSEGSNTIREFTEEELKIVEPSFPNMKKLGFKRTGLFVEDGMPQNGDPYTEGPDFPAAPADGSYHRMTYEGTAHDIPPRLHRFSKTKQRWIYLETDRRAQYNSQKAGLDEYISSPNSTPAKNIR